MNKQVSYAYQHLSRTETLGKCIHGSMYLCPALLIALGKFEYYGSGGCQIGDSIDSHNRPFSHIASVIECFNHKISIESNRIIGNFGDNSDITELDIKNFSYSSEDLSGPLVGGATKTALLLSVNKQKFIIKNPYLKTDVYDMIDFLRLIGKKIDISDNSIVCSGNVMASSNQYIEFNLTQCISEIITYSTLALINNTNLTFLDLNKKTISLTLKPEIDILLAMGVSIKWERNNLHIQKKGDIKGLNIEVTPTTIQSDHQPFFVLLSLYGSTDCSITEYVWKDRFMYVNNLIQLGANITIKDNTIFIKPSNLNYYCVFMSILMMWIFIQSMSM